MALRAVLFDFSGTLFRLEHEALEEHGDLMRALTAPVGMAEGLDPETEALWLRRDLDADVHRDVHVVALQAAGLTEPGAALAFYERLVSAAFWQTYPDTFEALRTVSEAGLRVAVVSNTGWNIRAVLDRFGVSHLVDEVVLSYEEGLIKPDPKIFLLACERLRVDPSEVLMVGDSEEADGGAAAVGSKVAIVEPLRTGERPTALVDSLRKHGIIPV
ncbi:HAD family hydrolase [Umezawaea endophytica]|uniref:HAD-IA family hydrolase n=1 Tax=Umezawaea endophytica TaxID=1654476 RepID=A0A9X2VLC5_9PSEU|nr:HAD-IA family hydrolase [Umezawaea endophytica]MCS7478803.1 HAD-IA family hydrolase [Umezawaea endophytica]